MAWRFITEAARLQPDVLEKVTVVMGNESCDIDSAASAIAYAFLQNSLAGITPNMGIFIPVLNVSKDDFVLRTEVLYYLKKCGIPIEDLYFRDTINFEVLISSSVLEVVLVDHHVLSENDMCLKPFVTEVIDHRPVDPDWKWENIKKTMEIVGSCATLVAEAAVTQHKFPVPQEVLMLLYGTIILDTSCFSETPKKYTDKDVSVVEVLENRLTHKPSRGTLYGELLSVRCDISGFSITQLLRKDMKLISEIPISSLPLLTQDFLSMPDAEEELEKFASNYPRRAVVMLGVSKLGTELKREIAVFAQEGLLLKALTDGLTKSKTPDLQLQQIRKFSDSGKLILFRQMNKEASRKQIVPLVKQAIVIYEKVFSPSGSSTDKG